MRRWHENNNARPGESTTVTYTVSRDELGTYTVEVDGLTVSFILGEVTSTSPHPLPLEIMLSYIAIAVIAVATSAIILIKKR